VRVRVLAAGVALPEHHGREGVHPETPPVPFTPGWDLVGVVDRLGAGISGIEPGRQSPRCQSTVRTRSFVCLPQRELIPVPSGLDAAEAVSLILNYITAYQMLHRSAKVKTGPARVVSRRVRRGRHGTPAAWAPRRTEMYGTCSSRGRRPFPTWAAIPIDYQHQDFVEEIHRLTSEAWTPSSTPSVAPTSAFP